MSPLHRVFRGTLGFAFAVSAPCALSSSTGATVFNAGSDKQLFIDTLLIASSHNVTLTMNPPLNTSERNLVSDRPWEEFYAGGWNTVMEDEGVYKMWYEARSFEGGTSLKNLIMHLCYATSRDGINWEKPALGLVEFRGSRQNNIVMTGSVGTVFLDPNRTGGDRYKYVGHSDGRSLWIWTSADGLHWKKLTDHPILSKPPFDTQNQIFWDDRINKFVAYVRRGAWGLQWPGPDPNDLRRVGRSESAQLESGWPEPNVVFSYDSHDPALSDHYNPCVIKYPYAANAYFMFPSAMYQYPGNELDGPLDIQMAASRDGIHWDRSDRRPYVRLGLTGADDDGSIYMSIGMLRKGAELWMYYTGYPFTHGAYDLKTSRHAGVVHRVVQRLDGFVSADAAYEGGDLTTVPMTFRGQRLVLNLDTSALGSTRVEILDPEGHVLPGFGQADCDPIIVNSVKHTVTWKGKSSLDALAGKAVRLRFSMRSTKLYAFQFAD